MDRKERLAIKKHLFDKYIQPDSEISFLQYYNIEIVDPEPYVDDPLVEILDNESDEYLTDDLFFQCLEDSIDYLAYEPFRKKIKKWQEQSKEIYGNEEEREQATENLSRISKILLPSKKRGRPAKWEDSEFALYDVYLTIIKKIAPFLKGVKNESPHKKIKLFKEKFPYWDEYASALRSHRTAKEIAKSIITKKYNISRRELIAKLKFRDELRTNVVPRTRDIPPTKIK